MCLVDVDDRIDAEAGKPLVEPPVDHFVNFLTKLRIFPVQVRLLFVEQVQVTFVRMPRERLPDTAAEVGAPVAGQLSVRAVFDVKILSVLAVRILTGLLKPFVLIGAVIDNEIHQDVHVALFGLGDQTVHVVHCAKARVDAVIIGNIVALIGKRRAVDRGEPDNIDAELLEIIELADDAGEITDAVSVGIIEALRVDLIGCFCVPPFFLHSSNTSL